MPVEVLASYGYALSTHMSVSHNPGVRTISANQSSGLTYCE